MDLVWKKRLKQNMDRYFLVYKIREAYQQQPPFGEPKKVSSTSSLTIKKNGASSKVSADRKQKCSTIENKKAEEFSHWMMNACNHF